ncbi:Acylphosphatase [Planctomycetes bacterium K23_9]|uniref:Acylphosphatase n=2 Tax=Stieleria marina TaxID=1930275 RepID=A0A517NZV2_9BACT|nr:Acylphosphatase [Planctomycetes bacterium K23_9]
MTCVTEASGLNVHGHVSNQSDGSVLMDVDASTADGKELVRRIQIARAGYIDDTHVESRDSLNRKAGFKIKS